MQLIKYEPISQLNLDAVKDLLFLRNKTLPEYVEWKYGANSPAIFRGVIAYENSKPVGCFGMVPKIFTKTNVSEINAGWFADWFVNPDYRGRDIGKNLLKELEQSDYPLLIGHPGGERALHICLDGGWKPIPFQSRRRFLIKGYPYYHHRFGKSTKAIPYFLAYTAHSLLGRFFITKLNETPASQATLKPSSGDHDWIISQPSKSEISRQFGVWEEKDSHVEFFDDLLPSGEKRRRILASNLHDGLLDAGKRFIHKTRLDGCAFGELFTTIRREDLFWQKLGAVPVKENPVVYLSRNSAEYDFELQGVDRENWTFYAH